MKSICLFALVALSPVAVQSAERTAESYKLQLTNGTRLSGNVQFTDKQRLRLKTRDGFVVTVPLKRVHTMRKGRGKIVKMQPLLPPRRRLTYKTIALTTEHTHTIRKNPTTQVHIRVVEWPGQTFLLWFPEVINNVWAQWDAAVAEQKFTVTKAGALVWSRIFKGKAAVVATLTPRDDSVFLEIRVKAAKDHDIRIAAPHNCLHFSAAPDFACDDYSRIYVRVKRKWRSYFDLRTAAGAPAHQSSASVIYRAGFLESKRANIWQGHVENRTMPDRVDHPLILCRSKSSHRIVATASEDYQGLFYNQGLPYLLCIHSAQTGVAIPRGKEAVFREIIWFTDGGLSSALAAYRRDVKTKLLQINRRALGP